VIVTQLLLALIRVELTSYNATDHQMGRLLGDVVREWLRSVTF